MSTPTTDRAAKIPSNYYDGICDVDFFARDRYSVSSGPYSIEVAEPGIPLWESAACVGRFLTDAEQHRLRVTYAGAPLACANEDSLDRLALLLRLESLYRSDTFAGFEEIAARLARSGDAALCRRVNQLSDALHLRRDLLADLPDYLTTAAPAPRNRFVCELIEGLRIRHAARFDVEAWSTNDVKVETPVRRDFVRRDGSVADRAALLRFYQETLSYAFELTAANNQVETLSNYARALRATGPGEGRRMLDYGAGIGTLSIAAARAGFNVDLIDLPSVTLDYATHRVGLRPALHSKIRLGVIDGDCIVPQGAWDVIACTEVLEHVFSPFELVDDLLDRLRPGGYFLVSESFDYVEEFCTHLPQHRGLGGDHFIGHMAALGLAPVFVEPDCHVQVWRKRPL